MRGGFKGCVVALMTTIAALALAAPAAAEIGCSFDSGAAKPRLEVLLTEVSSMRLEVVGNEVQPQTTGGVEVGCAGGSATTTTVDRVRIKATGRHSNSVTVDTPSAYHPGVEDEGLLNPDEIEIRVALGRGQDFLAFVGEDVGEQITVGELGVNLNAGDTTGPDVDLFPRSAEEFTAFGRGGDDELSGAGAAGTGDPYRRPLELNGESGVDTVVGGRAADLLTAGDGDDELRGGAGGDLLIGAPDDDDLFGQGGSDELFGAADADLINGGGGTDTAGYSDLSGPAVTVDIGVGGTNDGGSEDGPVDDRDEVLANVENLVGGTEDDDFTGDGDDNRLVGGLGVDSLTGLGGSDLLRAKDGIADALIDCGGGKDEARFDAGLDPAPLSC